MSADDDTYKGESPGKKFARYTFWKKAAQDLLGVDAFYKADAKFLVLASREGGDISVLKGVRVNASRIVAADMSASAVEACRAKHPDVLVELGDVANVASKHGPFDICFLDFCGYLSSGLVRTSAAVVKACDAGTVIGIAYMRGRERATTHTPHAVRLSRRDRRAMSSAIGLLPEELDILSGKDTNARRAIEKAEEMGDGEMARARCLESMLRATCAPWFPVLQNVIRYHSRSEDGGGVPMEIASFVLFVNPHSITKSLGSPAVRALLPPKMFVPVLVKCSATEDEIRASVLRGAFNPDPHLCLNIPASTIAAWKAHATRGTYAQQAAK